MEKYTLSGEVYSNTVDLVLVAIVKQHISEKLIQHNVGHGRVDRRLNIYKAVI